MNVDMFRGVSAMVRGMLAILHGSEHAIELVIIAMFIIALVPYFVMLGALDALRGLKKSDRRTMWH